VIYITFGGFALLDYFVSRLKYLPASKSGGQSAFGSSQPAKLYTKDAVKANPPGRLARALGASGTQ
jgi:hypothetical protein